MIETGKNTNAYAPTDVLRDATAEQLEQAVAFSHTELFFLNALSLGGEVFRSADVVLDA